MAMGSKSLKALLTSSCMLVYGWAGGKNSFRNYSADSLHGNVDTHAIN
jgi:hypothetical protein